MTGRSRYSRLRSDSGSVAVELVLFVPVLLALILLGATAHRVTSTQIALDSAAHASARAATIERDHSSAYRAAESTAAVMIPDRCKGFDLEIDTAGLIPGEAVTVTLTCQVDSLLRGVGDATVTATSKAPIDAWRGGEP